MRSFVIGLGLVLVGAALPLAGVAKKGTCGPDSRNNPVAATENAAPVEVTHEQLKQMGIESLDNLAIQYAPGLSQKGLLASFSVEVLDGKKVVASHQVAVDPKALQSPAGIYVLDLEDIKAIERKFKPGYLLRVAASTSTGMTGVVLRPCIAVKKLKAD